MRQALRIGAFPVIVALLSAGVVLPTPAGAQEEPPEVEFPPVVDFDIRGQQMGTLAFEALQALDVETPAAMSRQLDALRAEADGELAVRWSALTGAPNRILRLDGALTEPSGAPARAVAESFVERHRPLWNLSARDTREMRYTRDYKTRHNGVTHLTLQQRVNGVDVFGGEIRINVDSQGRVLNVSGEPMPNLRSSMNLLRAKLSSADALSAAGGAAGVDEPEAIGSSKAVYFPMRAGDLRLATQLTFEDPESGDPFEAIVDAADGTVLWLRRLVAYDHFPAHGDVYTSDSPFPRTPRGTGASVARQDVPFHGGDFFPHDDVHFDWWNGGPRTTTTSNNVDAYADRDGDNVPDPGSRPVAAAGEDFSFPIDLTQAPQNYQAAAVVNLFYWNNRLHDFFYQLGFDEASGNFQTNNFGLGGLGGDAVMAEAQDQRDHPTDPKLCNANMSFTADGTAPRMQMYQCTNAIPERDGDLDNVVIGHEYTHGVHVRLVPTSLNQAGNEGWCDYFGLALVAEPDDPYDGAYGVGDYLFNGNGSGIRSFPYSTDPAIYQRTYADINDFAACRFGSCSDNATETCSKDEDCTGFPGATCVPQFCQFHEDCEPPNTTVSQGPCLTSVHRTGELWANALWIARFNLIGRWGFETGDRTMNRLVIDGMKLSPADPTFLDGRDAILLADLVDNGGVNQCLVWDAFAKMGMGFSASTSGVLDINPIEAFNVPSGCRPDVQVKVDDFGDLGDACIGDSESGALEVCNIGEGFLVVGSITSSNPRFTVAPPPGGYPLVLGPSACQDVQVTFTPTATGAQTATLTVNSNDPVDPSVAVQVSGAGTVRDVSVTGSTDFGVVSAWSPGEKTVSVCNPGDCDLAVTGAAVNCPDFTLIANPFPATVGPGACLDLVVRFTPTEDGPKSCELGINTNDPDTPLITRTLTARTAPYFSLHAGLIDPNGSLSTVAKQGSVVNFDFVYPFTPQLAWDVRLGLGEFDGRAGFPDVDLLKLGANIRFLVNPAAPARIYLNGGLGLYHFSPGDFEAGLNLGLGINVPIGQRFAFETNYNYHNALTASPSREFNQFQLGFLVSF